MKWIVISIWRLFVAVWLAIALSSIYEVNVFGPIFSFCMFAVMMTAFECAATEDGKL